MGNIIAGRAWRGSNDFTAPRAYTAASRTDPTTDFMTDPQAASPSAPPRRLTDLPGPRGIPILGNTLQVRPGRIHQDMERWAREFGPLFHVRFGRRRVLVVADHALIGNVLRERPDSFRRPRRGREVRAEMGFPSGLFSAEGEDWRNQRRMVMAAFSPGNVRAFFPSLKNVTLRLRGRWQKAARADQAIDLQADLMRFTVDAISGLAFGAEVNTLESDGDVIQQHLDKVFPALFKRIFSPIPYWRFLRLEADRQLNESVKVINAAIADFVAQARQRLAADPARRAQPANLLEAMIVAADEPGSGVDDDGVAGNVFTMLLAGEDTTANTLAWMIHLLQRNPGTLARARDEVRRLAPDPEAFTPELMAQLEYLEACCNETMRLKPVAPNLPVEAVRDTVVAGVAVPADTLVWTVLRGDPLDDAHFPQAATFRPERWLGEETAGAKRVSIPFGSGPRMCPGRYLALQEMKMAMAMVLASFDIAAVETPDGGEAQEQMSFTMSPVGLRMRLRESA
jgi:cytochrome P450